MTTQELIKHIFHRISKFKFFIVLAALLVAVALYFVAKSYPETYSTRATVFPLTSAPDNSLTNNTLSSILGINDAPKSFSQDASINIVELAQSRNTREAVALERLPAFGNKKIADLLIDDYNATKPFFYKAIKKPKTDPLLAAAGGDVIKNNLTAKINKNGILEIVFSCSNEDLLPAVTNVIIDKISQFYKDLKIKKAKLDFDFTIKKIDSLDLVLGGFDDRAVQMANTTLFVPETKLQYQIPKENLSNEKERVLKQRDASASNREEALWRLQKVTPIIEVLDKPDPPFDVQKPSGLIYALVGLFVGAFLAVLLIIAAPFYQYAKAEVRKAIFGDEPARA